MKSTNLKNPPDRSKMIMIRKLALACVCVYAATVGGAVANQIGIGVTCTDDESGKKIDFFMVEVEAEPGIIPDSSFVPVEKIVDDWNGTRIGRMGDDEFGSFAFAQDRNGFRFGFAVSGSGKYENGEDTLWFNAPSNLIQFGAHGGSPDYVDEAESDYIINRVTGEYTEDFGFGFGHQGTCVPFSGDVNAAFQKYLDQIKTDSEAELKKRMDAQAEIDKPKQKKF